MYLPNFDNGIIKWVDKTLSLNIRFCSYSWALFFSLVTLRLICDFCVSSLLSTFFKLQNVDFFS